MNKNTIPVIIVIIVIICFGLAGLALVTFNIKNDEKHMFAPDVTQEQWEMMHNDGTEGMKESADPDDSHKDEH